MHIFRIIMSKYCSAKKRKLSATRNNILVLMTRNYLIASISFLLIKYLFLNDDMFEQTRKRFNMTTTTTKFNNPNLLGNIELKSPS